MAFVNPNDVLEAFDVIVTALRVCVANGDINAEFDNAIQSIFVLRPFYVRHVLFRILRLRARQLCAATESAGRVAGAAGGKFGPVELLPCGFARFASHEQLDRSVEQAVRRLVRKVPLRDGQVYLSHADRRGPN